MDSKNNTGTENTGDWNTGDWNTGDWNTGDWNTGDWNTGNRNTGNRNTGHWNTGYRNTGDWNTGDRNTGHWNTGYRNTGDWNTGDRNTGDWNTGDWNTGDRNTGDWNTGDWNTGHWNTGDRNTGYFNTITPSDVMVFDGHMTNREAFMAACPAWLSQPTPTTWIAESDMSDQEKIDNPTFHTYEGYLRKNDWLAEWDKAFTTASVEDVQKVRDLPGFDAVVFEKITGLNLAQPEIAQTITVNGVKYVRADQ